MPDLQLKSQLALDVTLNADAPLASFFVLPSHDELVAAIKDRLKDPQCQFLWIYGSSCPGKSHLLQAACDQ